MTGMNDTTTTTSDASRWHALAARVLDDHQLTADEGLAILRSDDSELLDLLAAAYRVRHRWFGNRVDLNFLINAKSGHVRRRLRLLLAIAGRRRPKSPATTSSRPKKSSTAPDIAAEQKAKTYCTVISGRSPTDQELDTLSQVIPQVKATYGLKICFSVGLLSIEQARRLKAAGVDRINHNLNTSERFYPQICTTHSYQDRLATLRSRPRRRAWKSAPAESSAWARRTPTSSNWPCGSADCRSRPSRSISCCRSPAFACWKARSRKLNPRYCLKVLALFRLANPRCELRIAAGREVHLGPLQPLGLYAANSIFVGGYLTTGGQAPEEDYRMIEALGFSIGR